MSEYHYLLDLVPSEALPGLLELFRDATAGASRSPALHVYTRHSVYDSTANEILRRLTAPMSITAGKTDDKVVQLRPTPNPIK